MPKWLGPILTVSGSRCCKEVSFVIDDRGAPLRNRCREAARQQGSTRARARKMFLFAVKSLRRRTCGLCEDCVSFFGYTSIEAQPRPHAQVGRQHSRHTTLARMTSHTHVTSMSSTVACVSQESWELHFSCLLVTNDPSRPACVLQATNLPTEPFPESGACLPSEGARSWCGRRQST